jgi:cysteinyl-tRNA synthetase
MDIAHEFPVTIYNSLGRRKQEFKPLSPGFVGMYVCGPTVYGDPHLGHARPAVTFDVVRRYFEFLGYRVRLVRNITDVGHLENEVSDDGEDKISKVARAQKLEPMEVVQTYTLRYHDAMERLNVLPPHVEPSATGHIIEQIETIKKMLANGYAYESNGSVYFDLSTYSDKHDYGSLSGKVLDDLLSGTRETQGQGEKRNSFDFALWKKAEPGHIMRWPSPWSEGFPGWHLECTTMSTKYLGERFDIHGGGLDLQFPHHEAEIAQSVGANSTDPVNYWMHNNMLTIEGQKMSKSLGNFITLEQLFGGDHPLLDAAYDPMTVRFFILQAHYRSSVDFSNQALQAAAKGLQRLQRGLEAAEDLGLSQSQAPDLDSVSRFRTGTSEGADADAVERCRDVFRALSDDFNTPQALSSLFELTGVVHKHASGESRIDTDVLAVVGSTLHHVTTDILGIRFAEKETSSADRDELVRLLIDIRQEARARKDFETGDRIRDGLKELGIRLVDSKDGTKVEYAE